MDATPRRFGASTAERVLAEAAAATSRRRVPYHGPDGYDAGGRDQKVYLCATPAHDGDVIEPLPSRPLVRDLVVDLH